MSRATRRRPDDRGISTVVSHVMSVGITTLLIISLVATATGFLEGQQHRSATQELETIGNRLAGELAAADRLARHSDGVNVTTTLPETIAGSTYSVQLQHGTCGAVATNTCLRLVASEYDTSTIVPVQNETELFLDSGPNGRFVISSAGSHGTPQLERRRIEMSPRVGIGQSVGTGPNFGPGTSLSQSPIPRFVIRPGVPQTGETVDFDASGSSDPDGSITTYEWDFDDDGSFEQTHSNPTAFYTFTSPGSHNVTLRVTDNAGLGNELTREIDVSGLEYNGDMTQAATNPQAVTFTVTNRHAEPIEIERILIDPADDSSDALYEDVTGDYHEIEIDSPPGGGFEGHVDWSSPIGIPEDGRIVNVNTDGDSNGGLVTVAASGGTARITVRNFTNGPAAVAGEQFAFGVRYRIGSNVNSNVFTDTVATP